MSAGQAGPRVDALAARAGARVSRPLDPATLAKLSGLTLRARLVVEGVLAGLHASPHLGASIEYADHKEYSPGDEVRHIDWKLYAKSDKLYLKRFEHETNLRAYLLVDGSGSMAYGRPGSRKWDYAQTLAASLAYVLLDQRDAVGLAVFRRGLERYVPPRSDRGHLKVLLETLAAEDPAGSGAAARALEELGARIPRRGLVILVSDTFEDPETLSRSLRSLRHRHHELMLCQVLDGDEIDLPFEGLTLFRGLEDEARLLADPADIRDAYREALEGHTTRLVRECRAHEIEFARFVTSEPLDRALVRFLGSRERTGA